MVLKTIEIDNIVTISLISIALFDSLISLVLSNGCTAHAQSSVRNCSHTHTPLVLLLNGGLKYSIYLNLNTYLISTA